MALNRKYARRLRQRLASQQEDRCYCKRPFTPAGPWRSAELKWPFDRRSYPVYTLLASLLAVGLFLCAMLGFTISAEIFPRFCMGPACAVVAGLGLRRLGRQNISGAMEAMGLIYLQGVAAFFSVVPLASISAPLADRWLSAADGALGFDWTAYSLVLGKLAPVPLLVYRSFKWQPVVVAFVLFLTGRSDRGWALVCAAILAVMITTAIFPFAPAVGSITYYQASNPIEPFAPALLALKSGTRTLDSSFFTGLVSFPSYHTAAAVIFAWGMWPTPLRWPAVVLNIAMALAAVVMGSHYLVDIIAGVCVGALSVKLATVLQSRFGQAGYTPRSSNRVNLLSAQ